MPEHKSACANVRVCASNSMSAGVSSGNAASACANARINFPDLDIVKLVMALFVVEIHTRPLVGFPVASMCIQGIDVLAVPFFFMCSAFLCFRGLKHAHFRTRDARGSVRVRKTIGKLAWLYVVWTVLFLPVTVYGASLSSKGLWQSVAEFARCTLLVGENFYSWPLWYLLASVVAFVLVYGCLRAGASNTQLVIISACFLLAGYFITWAENWQEAPSAVRVFVNSYNALFTTTRNGIFEGFFYVAVGAVLGMCEGAVRASAQQRVGMVAALLCGLVVGVAGCIFVNNDAHLPFCACASICLFVLSTQRRGENRAPHVALRNASTIIYLVHMFFVVAFVFGLFDQAYVDMHENELNPLLFVFALGGSILVSVIVIPVANKVPAVKKVFGL